MSLDPCEGMAERALWSALLVQWLADCIAVPSKGNKGAGSVRAETRRSREWIKTQWFSDVCGFAGVELAPTRAAFERAIAGADAAAFEMLRGGGLFAADPPVDPGNGTRAAGVGDGTHQHPLAGAPSREPKKIGAKILKKKRHGYTPVEIDRRRLPHSPEVIEKRMASRRVGRPLQLPSAPKVDGRTLPRSAEYRAKVAASMKATIAKKARDAAGVRLAAGAKGGGSSRVLPSPTNPLPSVPRVALGGAADALHPGHPVDGRTSVEGVLGAAVSTGGGCPPSPAAGEMNVADIMIEMEELLDIPQRKAPA